MIKNKHIPYNKPYFSGNEIKYINQAVVEQGKISGNGYFTQKCQAFFEEYFGCNRALLTTSCTDALEMVSLLLNIKEGDEVIIPSYTSVSTANPFVLRGANIVFADSRADQPNVDVKEIERLISSKTKAIVVVHYAGFACEMDEIMEICETNDIPLIEDAAQAIDSFYKGKRLGTFGCMSTFSFHETKNIISGEGGVLILNDAQYSERAEIIWEKGTNRSKFFQGGVNKYNWLDLGSSFLPSEINAAYLFAQLENLEKIQSRRKEIWMKYLDELLELEKKVVLPCIPDYATTNGHIFFLVTKDLKERDTLLKYLRGAKINAVFHYLPLHLSPYYKTINNGSLPDLYNSSLYGKQLIRLPLFVELKDHDILYICETIKHFFL